MSLASLDLSAGGREFVGELGLQPANKGSEILVRVAPDEVNQVIGIRLISSMCDY